MNQEKKALIAEFNEQIVSIIHKNQLSAKESLSMLKLLELRAINDKMDEIIKILKK